MFIQLETTTINKVRNELAEYHTVIANGLSTKLTDPEAPTPNYGNLASAVSTSWSVFHDGDKEKAFSTFLHLLTQPETQVKQESSASSTNRIESDQSQSHLEIEMIDSPTLYKLPEEDEPPAVIDGRIAREDLDDNFEPLHESAPRRCDIRLSDDQVEQMLSGNGLF